MIAVCHITALLCLFLPTFYQTINGIKPVDDGTKSYAKAFVKQYTENPSTSSKQDQFLVGYLSFRSKVMASLVNTKYTAAHLGMCGTMLGIYDADAGRAIKVAADRITKGDKDFDSLAPLEVEAINKALAKFNPFTEKLPGKAEAGAGPFLAGARLGMLASRVTLWHISPKQKILLGDMTEAMKACAESGETGKDLNADLASALKEFAAFKDKELDEMTVRKIGKQIEIALRASLPEKYRWSD
jgi:hypothetical protein